MNGRRHRHVELVRTPGWMLVVLSSNSRSIQITYRVEWHILKLVLFVFSIISRVCHGGQLSVRLSMNLEELM